ncbi:MAG: glycosyltransferase [Bacteroidota bacterium]|nr:glycosyltransferase [Bacteroidota bacterium]
MRTEEPLLTLCIPTYQRADILLNTGKHHISLVEQYDLPLIISNNCSTDHTEDVAHALKELYTNVEYYRHETNIYDKNFPFVLRKSKTPYAWLLGDKHKIKAGSIERFFELVKDESFDLIVTNHDMHVKNIPTQVYTDPARLLSDLGWHMTDITSLIFSKDFIEKIPFERFSGTNFMHTGGIFEAFATHPCKVLWVNENFFERITFGVKSGWVEDMFDVWMKSWPTVIMALPPSHYSLQNKVDCIKRHNVNTKMFTFKKIKIARRCGKYNFKEYKKLRIFFRLCSNRSGLFFLYMAVFPKWILKFMLLVQNTFNSIFLKHKRYNK